MRRPFVFVAALAATAVGAAAVTADAQVVPYPTPTSSTEPPEIPQGECSLAGSSIPSPQDGVVPTLIVRCAISDTTTRLFEIPLSETDRWALGRLLEVADQFDDDDGVTVH